MSFSKDALIHKVNFKELTLEQVRATRDGCEEKLDKLKETNMKEIVREALYGFIEYYTQDELDRVDLRIIADKYIDDNCGKEE